MHMYILKNYMNKYKYVFLKERSLCIDKKYVHIYIYIITKKEKLINEMKNVKILTWYSCFQIKRFI